MRRIVLALVTAFSMLCLVACGGDTQDNVPTNGNEESVIGNSVNEPTAKPVVEATAEPTEEPAAEATPAPTEEPSVVYEGIDMESTLPGQEWLETFVGVIDEPKVVVFSDKTGKKVIVEQEGEVVVNPDEDAMALFFPEGYSDGNVSQGIVRSDKKIIETENYEIFYLDAEKMREVDESKAAFLVMNGEEKIILIVNLKIE